MILRQWVGDEDSPAALLKTGLLSRVKNSNHLDVADAIDACAIKVNETLGRYRGLRVDKDFIRNLIHSEQTKHGLGLLPADEYGLAQQILDSFAE